MRTHDRENDEHSLRPKASRLDAEPSADLLQAAATGRTDVLDGASILRLQRAVGNSGVGAVLEEERSPVHDVIQSGRGSALAPDLQEEMGARLGQDFSDVRVHTDTQAHDSAKAVNAHAYTVGNNVVFQRDKYDPSSTEGKTMLAHELTHVVQQRSGPVDGTAAAGGIKVSDPSDRFEREASANADRAMSAALPAPVSASGPALQREEAPAEEEDESVQTFVQRQDEEEEETVE